MKKFFCTAAVLICVGLFSGCEGNVPNVSENAVTAAETSIETAAFSESTVTMAETSQTKITEETTTVSETETSAETTEWEDIPPKHEILDMSDYTGNFYEWEYDYDIVAYDRESFAGGEEVLAAAEEILSDRDDLRFEEGVWEDFDGDGKKEGFLLYSCGEIHGFLGCRLGYVVFADEDCGVKLLEDSAGVEGKLNPIRYNGFIHMCTDFGANIATTHMEIYAVEENSAVKKYADQIKGKPLDGAFMLVPHLQGGGNSIIFWNEQRREYCSLISDRITEEDINDIAESEAFAGSSYERMATDEMDTATVIRTAFFMYGGKYFFTASGFGYERQDGKIISSDKDVTMLNYDKCTMAKGVNIDKAQENMVRLEK